MDNRRNAGATRGTLPERPLEKSALAPPAVAPPEVAPPRRMAYGLDISGYSMARGRVKKNENLSRILQPYGVGYAAILDVAYKARGVFDVRSLRPGRPYHLLRPGASPDVAPRYFIYEESDESFVVFDLAPPRSVTRGSKPVELKTRSIAGTVEGSLWQALKDLEADPALLYRLSDIYAWTVDFHHLQKQDRFQVVYQEKWIDGRKKGMGHVLAAAIHRRGETSYAFRFEGSGRPGYYDENGKSLEKTFLKAPLRYTRISSRYARNRLHPVLRIVKAHLGTDYAAPTGTPIMSTGDGTVTTAASNRANGRYIKIRHNREFSTQYLHLSRFASGIRSGVSVKQGQIIGYVGATGMVTGPHLCYRFWKHGKQVDPLAMDIPSSRDLPPAQREVFLGTLSERMALLNDADTPVTLATKRDAASMR
jgi:murein DD-endopeptidase MepM/ murein hydrolase activator NlpD